MTNSSRKTAKKARGLTPAQLFQNNRDWAAGINAKDAHFFSTLANQQTPEYMWIGCSDSRVSASDLLGLLPGELFVHRNIANVVVHSDLNCLSVLQFAVELLKVKHVIVCGHYGCSGVEAALSRKRIGLADNWLRHVQDVQHKHGSHLGKELSHHVKHNRLCELNVIEQVNNLCQTTIVNDAWERKQELTIHGWIYGLQDGLLRDLGMSIGNSAMLPAALKNALLAYEKPAISAGS